MSHTPGPNSLGFHRGCGGPVRFETHIHMSKRSGPVLYARFKCSRCCAVNVPEDDIERAPFPTVREATAGVKRRRSARYDIRGWRDVK